MKRILALVVVFGFVLGLGGCAGLFEAEKEVKIGIGMGSVNHPVHRIVQYGFDKGIEHHCATKVDATMDEGSAMELIENFRKAIEEEGAQGMLIWTSDDTFYQFMRDMKKEHGTEFVIPHFSHEYVDTKDFIAANLHYDDRKMGEMAADMLVEALHAKGITSGSIGNTQAGASVTTNAASDAFRHRLKEIAPQFRVTDVVFEGVELSAAATKIVGLIKANPDIVGAFGTTGGSATAWTKAMEDTGRTDLVVIGVDFTAGSLDVLENGPISGLMCTPLYDEGYDSVGILHDVIHGKSYNQTKEDWSIVYDVVGLTKDSDLTPYRDLIRNITENLS
ncbi:MAG: substrate-binding domain-containing protein [Clostridia bacterium]|nr:substrate-binding domain-containing protein [Clostridia bacterium]